MIRTFLKLGFFAFGGPAAHVAMLEEEVVTKHQWIRDTDFADLNTLTNLVPGPNSSELVLGVGYHISGYKGLFIAGLSFIAPAVVMVLLLTYFFSNMMDNRWVVLFLEGLRPVLFLMIFKVFLKFFNLRVKNTYGLLIFISAVGLKLLGMSEINLLLLFSLFAILRQDVKNKVFSIEPISLITLFLLFLKIGATLYGSGYVLFSYMESFFLNYATKDQLINAMLIGELTPGPVFTTATSLGVFLHGITGGLVATVGIFLPSFLFMMILMPIHNRVKEMKFFKIIMDVINIAVVGILFIVLIDLGIETFITWQSFVLLGVVSVLMFRFKVSNYLIMGIAPIINILLTIFIW